MSETTQRWYVAGHSVAGAMHDRTQEPCEDAHFILARGSHLVATVCDGAGSASQSAYAAQYVSKQITRRFFKLLRSGHDLGELASLAPDGLIMDALTSVRGELLAYATDEGWENEDVRCTLTSILMMDDNGFFISLGDCTGFATQSNDIGGKNTILCMPPPSEHSNETYFLSDSIFSKYIKSAPIPSADIICLLSDGCNFMYQHDVDAVDVGLFEPRHKDLIQFPRRKKREHYLNAFLTHKYIRVTHLGDDKTMVWAHLR